MKKLVLLMTLLSLMSMSHAEDKGNGGDECEREIKVIRSDIRVWIVNGGASSLELPSNLSLNEYKDKMIEKIDNTAISCVSEKIEYLGVEKTCINQSGTIVCNNERFLREISGSGQYRLIHHEYAGLAGFETNDGSSESRYLISNQITDYLELSPSLKLSVKGERKASKIKLMDSKLIKFQCEKNIADSRYVVVATSEDAFTKLDPSHLRLGFYTEGSDSFSFIEDAEFKIIKSELFNSFGLRGKKMLKYYASFIQVLSKNTVLQALPSGIQIRGARLTSMCYSVHK